MSPITFSIIDTLKISWKLWRVNAWLFIGVFAAYLIVLSFDNSDDLLIKNLNFLKVNEGGWEMAKSTATWMAFQLIGSLFMLLALRVGLASASNTKIAPAELMIPIATVANFLIATVYVEFISLLPMTIAAEFAFSFNDFSALAYSLLIVSVVWGVYAGIRLMFVPLFTLEARIGPLAALKQSLLITHDRTWKLIGLILAQVSVVILGALSFFIGLLIALPIAVVMQCYVYLLLTEKIKHSEEIHEESSVAAMGHHSFN